MERLLLTLAIGAVAALAAWLVQSRVLTRTGKTGPTQTGTTPDHLDRGHFVAPTADWLIAVFSSATCLACADVTRTVSAFESDRVAYQDVEHKASEELHKRYRIDSVPTTVVVDRQGVVHGAWVGPLSPADSDELSAVINS